MMTGRSIAGWHYNDFELHKHSRCTKLETLSMEIHDHVDSRSCSCASGERLGREWAAAKQLECSVLGASRLDIFC